jgi:hypothetical protein
LQNTKRHNESIVLLTKDILALGKLLVIFL